MTKVLIFKQEELFGLRDIKGDVLLDAIFEKIKYLNQDRFAVLKNNFWAIVDSKGNFLTDYKYKNVDKYFNGRARVLIYDDFNTYFNDYFNSYKIVDLKGKELELDYTNHIIDINNRYNSIIRTFSEDRYIAKSGNIYNLLDHDGKFVDGGKTYVELNSINENIFLAKEKSKKIIINENHDIILEVPNKFDEIYNQMSNGLYQVVTNTGLGGYIDSKGNEIIPTTYYVAYEFSNDVDLAFVMISEEKGGYINSKNEFIIPPEYDLGRVFHSGIAGVLKNNKYFFINEQGEKISENYLYIGEFINGYVNVTLSDGRKAYLDSNLNVMFYYEDEINISYFINDIATITKEGKVGLINPKGEILIEPKYEEIYISEYCDIHRFKENNLVGYITSEGKIVLEAKFERATSMGKNGCALVEREFSIYLVKKFGKEMREMDYFDYQFSEYQGFNDSKYAVVYYDAEEYAFIDSDGNFVGDKYESIREFYKGQAFVTVSTEYILIDKNGELINTKDFNIIFDDGELVLESKKINNILKSLKNKI